MAWTGVFGFTGPSAANGHFDIQCVGDSGANATLGYYGLHRYGWEIDIVPIDLEWHHLAATYDGVAVSWYGDGQLIGSIDTDPADIAAALNEKMTGQGYDLEMSIDETDTPTSIHEHYFIANELHERGVPKW